MATQGGTSGLDETSVLKLFFGDDIGSELPTWNGIGMLLIDTTSARSYNGVRVD
jgi:hypothetical protein